MTYRTAVFLAALVLMGAGGLLGAPAVAESTSSHGLSYGANFTAELTTDDPYAEASSGYHDTYTFEGSEGDVISLEMRPEGDVYNEDHAARLVVYGPDGDPVRDTYQTKGSAHITRLELSETGTYTVVATTQKDRDFTNVEQYESDDEAFSDVFSYQLRLTEGFGDSPALEYNASTTGELTPNDDFDPDTNNGYYDTYTFEGDEGDVVSLEMRPEGDIYSDDHAAKLLLYGPDGDLVRDTTQEKGGAHLTRLELSETGIYTVVATTQTDRDFINVDQYDDDKQALSDTLSYQLRLTKEFGDIPSIEYNSSTTGELTQSDNFHDNTNNGYHDAYAFEGEEGDVVSLEMRPEGDIYSDNHATKLLLYGPDGDLVRDTTQEKGGAHITRLELPETGTYTVVATTQADESFLELDQYEDSKQVFNDTFSYELRLTEGFGDIPSIEYNSSTTGELTQSDDFHDHRNNGYHDAYAFEGEEGDVVSLEMRPGSDVYNEDHAAKLLLYGPNGEIVRDTSQDKGSAHITRLELPEAGTYTVVATTQTDESFLDLDQYEDGKQVFNDTFSYELRLTEGFGETPSIEYNSSTTGELTQNDDFHRLINNGYHDAYAFEGEEGDVVSLEMRPEGDVYSDDHAAKLLLYGPGGQIVRQSNQEKGSAHVTRLELPETGTYTVVATTQTDGDFIDVDQYDDSKQAFNDTLSYELRLIEGYGDSSTHVEYGDRPIGELEPSDDFQPRLSGYHDTFMFDGIAGELVSLELRPDGETYSDDHAAKLLLYGPNGNQIRDTQQDTGSAQMSRVELPETGRYTAVATTQAYSSAASPDQYDDESQAYADTFEYQFRLYEAGEGMQTVAYGDSVVGELSISDNFQSHKLGFFDRYRLSIAEGDTVTFSINPENSDDHAPQLLVYGPEGSWSSDGTSGEVSLTVSPDLGGTYVVYVTTEPARDTDVYDSPQAAQTAQFEYFFNVSDAGNNPPILDVEPSDDRVAVGQEVTLDASGTVDPNGDSLTYEWTQDRGLFKDPEVTFDDPDSAAPSFVVPEVSEQEDFVFDLTVTDSNGAERTATVEVTADPDLSPPEDSPDDEPTPPSATFSFAPDGPTTGESVTFDASGSSDPDGSVQSYAWDFGTDGTTDASGVETTYTFDSTGEKTVTLTVTDDEGNTRTASETIEVSSGETGTAEWSLSVEDVSTTQGSNVTVASTVTNDGTAAGSAILDVGRPSELPIVTRSDAGGTWSESKQKWLWQTVDSGESVNPGVTLSVADDTPTGTYTVEFELKAGSSVVATDEAVVEVTEYKTVPEAIAGSDGKIGDFELLRAIELWRTDSPVPDTGGETIGDFQLLNLIESWRTDEAV